MDLDAIKHMTLHKATLDMCKIITSRNLHLDDNNVVQAIGIGFIIVKQSRKVK